MIYASANDDKTDLKRLSGILSTLTHFYSFRSDRSIIFTLFCIMEWWLRERLFQTLLIQWYRIYSDHYFLRKCSSTLPLDGCYFLAHEYSAASEVKLFAGTQMSASFLHDPSISIGFNRVVVWCFARKLLGCRKSSCTRYRRQNILGWKYVVFKIITV